MEWVILVALAFVISLVGSFVAGLVIVRLPANYFSESGNGSSWARKRHILGWPGLIFKNILGAIIVAIGIVLAVPGVPGPGLLIVLIGIGLMDFPGKRRLELWIIRRPTVLASLNRLRRLFKKRPFDVPTT